MMKGDSSLATTAYSEVSTNDDSRLVEDKDNLSELFLDRPVLKVTNRYGKDLPEAKDLAWSDTFFDNDEDEIIAVFDFEYDDMEKFNYAVGWVALGATLIYPPIFAIAMVGLTPCFLRKNVSWEARSKHVAITRDGIRFVQDKRQSCWGLPCTDRGKLSKTIPFDKITDCDVEEPAGNTCICIPNILMKVNVDTASSGSAEHRHQLKIAGLKDAYAFKKLVWAMKRSQHHRAATGNTGTATYTGPTSPSGLEMVERSSDSDNVTSLLRDIRDELRQNNDLLKEVKASTSTSSSGSSSGQAGVEPSAATPECSVA